MADKATHVAMVADAAGTLWAPLTTTERRELCEAVLDPEAAPILAYMYLARRGAWVDAEDVGLRRMGDDGG